VTALHDWSELPPFDPEQVIATLNRNRVRYVVIGGYAAQLLGARVATQDIDITPARDRENYGSLAAALQQLDARLRAQGIGISGIRIPLDERTFRGMITVTFITRCGPVDIAIYPDGATRGYEELAPRAQNVEVSGLAVSVAHLSDIIRSKEAAGRAKDLEALPELRRRLAEIEKA
jgi:hypothetical protein